MMAMPKVADINKRDGLLKAVGPVDRIDSQFQGASFETVIDASGMCVTPGLIDAHTHPVWAGDRVHEFAMKLAGATYMEVHQAGGGIHFTVEHTRQASEAELLASLKQRLLRMLRTGTTLVECKSGYGLELDTEVKMLSVIERARKDLPIGISSTYCGAHSVPKGKTAAEATDDIIKVQLLKLKEKMSKGELHVDNIDVFCEKGVFDLECTRAILQAGKDMGLQINFHGDELHPMNSAEPMVMHLACVNMKMSMKEALAAATINAAYSLGKSHTHGSLEVNKQGDLVILNSSRLKQPRARDMLDAGVIVALGSDFNPNAYCCSMPMVMHLACVNMKMSMKEALAAATINAAYSLGKSHTHGSLEVNKQGDLVILNSSRWEHLIYQFGGHQELIKFVIVKGKVVYENDRTLDY
ncbi:UNVERIFIED_CONTAM: hypothetical protein FKN15_006578 [Acipenser sinensis]